MSKIAEQKALEEYPKSYVDENMSSREGYVKGYDQAFENFMEKAEKWIEKHIEMFSWVHCDSDGNEEWRNDFKNYMQDEM